jgi:hypothetical protein
LQYFSFCFDELSIGLGSCRAALGTTQLAQISDDKHLIKFAIGQLRNHMLIDKLLHTLARQIEVFSELGGYDGIAAGNLVLLRRADGTDDGRCSGGRCSRAGFCHSAVAYCTESASEGKRIFLNREYPEWVRSRGPPVGL